MYVVDFYARFLHIHIQISHYILISTSLIMNEVSAS